MKVTEKISSKCFENKVVFIGVLKGYLLIYIFHNSWASSRNKIWDLNNFPRTNTFPVLLSFRFIGKIHVVTRRPPTILGLHFQKYNYNCNSQFSSTSNVPGTLVRNLYELTHFIFAIIPWSGNSYYPHFTGKEIYAQDIRMSYSNHY